jgi:DNA-binding protein HU-beta
MGVPVNKNELIASVAQRSGLSKIDAGKAVDGMISSIETTLKSGGDVRIVGFGTFSVSNRAATTGRNPRTGEAIAIPASKQPKFKAGAPLKAAVNR